MVIGMPAKRRHSKAPPPPSKAYRLHRAAEIIAAAEGGEPLSPLLRARLRRPSPGWRPADTAAVVELVHGWFRWRGGFAGAASATAVATAARLQERFAADPAAQEGADLASRALPPWAADFFTDRDIRALQQPPVLWLRARPGTGEALAESLPRASRPLPWAPDALRYAGAADLFRHSFYRNGSLEIQDLSSQVVTLLANAQPGETWWDVCAGEGGKTMGLADAMDNRGTVRATERQAWRLDRLRRRAARLGLFNIRPESWDGSRGEAPFRSWCDGVLVDAPCSGLGTWRRDPAARWTTDPSVIERLAPLQATLLDRAARRVRPGGRLIYAVCTLSPTETVAQAAAFAERHPGFDPLPLHLPPIANGTPTVTIRPGDHDSNGMFIAAWHRRE